MEFESYLNAKIDLLPESRTREAMRYSLLAGGKRLRPKLVFAVLKGYGKPEQNGADYAAGLEMIHTYSLIHDDLPAMDNDDLRRGRPTCHKQFDEATAILAGDGLLTYAFQVVSSSTAMDAEHNYKAVYILSKNAGADGMVLGQDLDIKAENSSIGWDELKRVHYYKTGCLFSSALMLGALAGRQNDEVLHIWDDLGKKIGLAFQIQDDILDVKSSPELLGKSNSDARNGKVTSVTLLGLEESENMMNRLYKECIDELNSMKDFDSSELITLLEGIMKRTF